MLEIVVFWFVLDFWMMNEKARDKLKSYVFQPCLYGEKSSFTYSIAHPIKRSRQTQNRGGYNGGGAPPPQILREQAETAIDTKTAPDVKIISY